MQEPEHRELGQHPVEVVQSHSQSTMHASDGYIYQRCQRCILANGTNDWEASNMLA